MQGSDFDESRFFGAIADSGARALLIDRRALVAVSSRRYPTPAERLAYARRAYRRWTATHERTCSASNSVRTDHER